MAVLPSLTADAPPLHFPITNDAGGTDSKYAARDHYYIQHALRYDNRHSFSRLQRATTLLKSTSHWIDMKADCGPRPTIQSRLLRSRSALLITDTELRLIASAATIGESSCPVKG